MHSGLSVCQVCTRATRLPRDLIAREACPLKVFSVFGDPKSYERMVKVKRSDLHPRRVNLC
jgi:hypothetical protein